MHDNNDELLFISLGFNCHIKMYLRNKKMMIEESLPFENHISHDINSIINTLDELYENKKYSTEFKRIAFMNKDTFGLAVIEKNDINFCHYFKKNDVIENTELIFPMDTKYIKNEKIEEVTNMINRRYLRLLDYVNTTEPTLCLIRVDLPKKEFDKNKLMRLTNILHKFDNKKMYLIYINKNIEDELCYNNCNKINTEYSIPIFFFNKTLDDKYFATLHNNFTDIINDFKNYIARQI